LLSDAVAADPALVEARVRLGRVQWRLGEDAAARATLEEAVRRGGAAPVAYLAHLFLGQVWERSGHAEEAIREFTRALELDPQAQAAAVALSQALLSTGDVDGARRVLGQSLAHAGQRVARDAQWDYVASNAALAEDLVEELRQETLE
jgi:tetratricopeptide (TPR) repeat protein